MIKKIFNSFRENLRRKNTKVKVNSEQDFELSEDQLEIVSGGVYGNPPSNNGGNVANNNIAAASNTPGPQGAVAPNRPPSQEVQQH